MIQILQVVPASIPYVMQDIIYIPPAWAGAPAGAPALGPVLSRLTPFQMQFLLTAFAYLGPNVAAQIESWWPLVNFPAA